MLHFFTFAVDIKKHSTNDLTKCLDLLFMSMKKYIKTDFEIIVFTNFQIQKIHETNISYRPYYDMSIYKLYSDKWLNLSYNKINIYKDLYDEFKKDFIWIDLDTVVSYDISYLEEFDHWFTVHGGTDNTTSFLFQNDSTFSLPIHKTIQGNFWKINIKLYYKLMSSLQFILQKKLKLYYDLQNLFNYQIYFVDKDINYNILGSTVQKNALFGLTIWSKEHRHPNIDGLNLLFRNDHNILKTSYEPDKEIHIVSFTFNTIKLLWNTHKFKQLFI